MDFLKQLIQKGRDRKVEQKVLIKYKELAGALGNGGEMINRDKENRARSWVKEQEKFFIPKESFWKSRTIQGALITGTVAIVLATIGLLANFYLLK